MSDHQFAWAAQRLWRHRLLIAAMIAVSVANTLSYEESTLIPLLLLAPTILVFALLEMRFFSDALIRHGVDAPENGLLAFGFLWRWAALAFLYIAIGFSAMLPLLLYGVVTADEAAAEPVLAFVFALCWWAAYALFGAIFPAFLSGRSSGFSGAMRRPGLSQRFRVLAPAALIIFAAFATSNMLTTLAFEALPSAAPDAAYSLVVALTEVLRDLATTYAIALGARALTDQFLGQDRLGDETVRVFE